MIDYPHHEVHGGSSFRADFVDISMSNTDTLILAFKTPTGTKRAHMTIQFDTLVGGHLKVWEAPTLDANSGTQQAILNRKRETSMTSSMLLEDTGLGNPFTATDNVISNPTGLAGGTLLHEHYAWGKKEKFAGGGARDTEELILKPDTLYAVVFTAVGDSNAAQVFLDWYEHTDSN